VAEVLASLFLLHCASHLFQFKQIELRNRVCTIGFEGHCKPHTVVHIEHGLEGGTAIRLGTELFTVSAKP